MFNDAIEDGLADANPFANLNLEQGRGRRDITPLTDDEVHRLAEISEQEHGLEFGREFGSMIFFSAYTGMRPGEIFAARYSHLEGDVYRLDRQFNTRVGRETEPKHGGIGNITSQNQRGELCLRSHVASATT